MSDYTVAQGLQDFQNAFTQGQQDIYTATQQPNPFAPTKTNPTKKPDTATITPAPTENPTDKNQQTEDNDKDKQDDQQKYKWYWIAGGVVLVLIIGIVLYTANTKKRKP